MTWNKWVRQIHRWAGALVIAFTVTVAVSFVALGQEDPALWVLYLPLPPLALQLLTGLYLFVSVLVRAAICHQLAQRATHR